MSAPLNPAASWPVLLRAHAQAHRAAAAGLLLATLVVVALLVSSVTRLVAGSDLAGLRLALLGGLAGAVATALGALPALILRELPRRVEAVLLGFAAGMMLAASAFSLLLPGIEAAAGMVGGRLAGAGVVVVGIALGVLLMLGLDAFTPHEHDSSGRCGPGNEQCERIWLFVFAIALHNLPEGMAIGVSFAQADLAIGVPLTTAIALQDIPEGLAVALSIRAAGYSPRLAVGIAAASGLLEPIGALLGAGLSSGAAFAYPVGLGLAAGAMIFVVSHEVIPETHRDGQQTPATLGLMAGFALMMMLDTGLA